MHISQGTCARLQYVYRLVKNDLFQKLDRLQLVQAFLSTLFVGIGILRLRITQPFGPFHCWSIPFAITTSSKDQQIHVEGHRFELNTFLECCANKKIECLVDTFRTLDVQGHIKRNNSSQRRKIQRLH